jgi:putative chitinase
MPAPFDRKAFFDAVRSDPFDGSLTSAQVEGMETLFDVWEALFALDAKEQSVPWFAYALATVFHETAATMKPIEEYGKGEGRDYGEPAGPYDQCYYGRGHVQLTWEENYQKGEDILEKKYGMTVPLHQYPHRMLEDEPSAIVLFDGMIDGWFTGVGLPDFFNEDEEDPVNARKIINALDKADLIAGYYGTFKKALKEEA